MLMASARMLEMDEKAPLEFLLNSQFRDKYPRRLVAQFPRVAAHIESIWEDKAAVADYLADLMIPARANRQGFPPDVATEIMSLSIAYDAIGHLVSPAPSAPGGPVEAYHWEDERNVEEIESLGFPFTREGFARAVEAGREDVCQRFLKAGYNIDSRDARYWTPLMIAAFYGREALALRLIQMGADIRAMDKGGYSSLHWAAFSGFAKVVALLLDQGMPANQPSQAGITPLLQAAARGHVDIVELLLAHQANPNLNAKDGASPLLKAVANNHFDVALMLINAGAYRNLTMPDGVTLEDLVEKARDPRIRALFT